MSDLVSVILPTYNGEKYIKQAIDSCLNQTYEDIELIIVDDGSIDGTERIIRAYKDKRIKYIKHKENMGLPCALNTGFANAIGEFLTWTSDDNYYAMDAIEKMLSFLKEKSCEFVYCDYYKFDDNHPDLRVEKLSDDAMKGEHNDVGTCILYSRRVMESVGDYDPCTFLAEDYDYWMRISKKFPMCHLSEALYFYRESEDSLSSRFYKDCEVQIVVILVNIKHDVMSIDQAVEQFIDIVSRKKASKVAVVRIVFYPEFVVLKRVFKFLYGVRVSEKIRVKLEDFKMERISFDEAKEFLKNIAR